MSDTARAPRNRTLSLTGDDRERLSRRILRGLPARENAAALPQGTLLGDCLHYAQALARNSVDLLILDPPYNISKNFHGNKFVRRPLDDYTAWLSGVIEAFLPSLKPHATVYICGDWYTSASVFEAASEHLIVQNRITWEREKGRGSLSNWKNSSEDIWFCTRSKKYTFNVDAVKLRRKVVAPYRHADGAPKDWLAHEHGNYRDTCPSNFWGDITIPFWSMPENTDHPTQKSEKLIAKLMMASSNAADTVLDPFVGSGTTSVVAKKLGRRYLGIEVNEEYCLWTEKRLELAEADKTIQGFVDGVFWERNTLALMQKESFLGRRPSGGPVPRRDKEADAVS